MASTKATARAELDRLRQGAARGAAGFREAEAALHPAEADREALDRQVEAAYFRRARRPSHAAGQAADDARRVRSRGGAAALAGRGTRPRRSHARGRARQGPAGRDEAGGRADRAGTPSGARACGPPRPAMAARAPGDRPRRQPGRGQPAATAQLRRTRSLPRSPASATCSPRAARCPRICRIGAATSLSRASSGSVAC